MSQLCYFHRLLNVEGAVKRVASQLRAADPKSASSVREADLVGRAMLVQPQLQAAAEAMATLRGSSQYHWVQLGRLFSVLADG